MIVFVEPSGLLDDLVADAWPPAEQIVMGEWRFRWTSGVTRRANSVLARGNEAQIEQLVAFGEKFYLDRGGPSRFLVSRASAPSELAAHLLGRGYRAHDRTLVMTIDTAQLLARSEAGDWAVERSAHATPDWFRCYWQADSPRPLDTAEGVIHRQTLLAPVPASSFVLLHERRDGVAVGQIVFDRGWGGLQCIATMTSHRRRGAAGAVLHQLALQAEDADISRLYLVVLAENLPAISLYASLGFAVVHEYAYFTS
jgi:ribosomal protein S18 acetylase RimI-like enzyme